MATNFWGMLYPTLALLPEMRARRSGRIVNITSIGGKLGIPHLLPYSASKFAAVGFSQGLRAELAGDGIKVVTVCPGLMRTGSPRNAIFRGQHRSEYAWFSISDALPGLSISAESAARRIVAACRRGDAEVLFPHPGQAGFGGQRSRSRLHRRCARYRGSAAAESGQGTARLAAEAQTASPGFRLHGSPAWATGPHANTTR